MMRKIQFIGVSRLLLAAASAPLRRFLLASSMENFPDGFDYQHQSRRAAQ